MTKARPKTFSVLKVLLDDKLSTDLIYYISKYLPKKLEKLGKVHNSKIKESRKEKRYYQVHLNMRKLSF